MLVDHVAYVGILLVRLDQVAVLGLNGVNIVQRPELNERDRAGMACFLAASLSASVDGSLRTRMSTLRTDISTLGKVIL